MFWHQKWRILSARIDGLRQAGEYLGQVLPRAPGDSFGIVRRWISAELGSIVDELERFKASHGTQVPPDAGRILDRILQRDWFTDRPELVNEGLISIGALVTFRSSFEYLTQDAETDVRSRTELAFEHLRRLILVDEEVRAKWLRHRKEGGERSCEKLGAVHLLSHGILAFKVDGQRGITDLVFSEPLDVNSPVVHRAARALVLTEWKIANKSADVRAKADEAREQLKDYEGGTLGDIELTRTRFIIIVSEDRFQPPQDHLEGPITYRHIAVSLSPLTPSRAARTRAK
jgi:hypothetical protein